MILQHISPGAPRESPSINELLGIRRRLAADQPLDAPVGGVQAAAEAVELGFDEVVQLPLPRPLGEPPGPMGPHFRASSARLPSSDLLKSSLSLQLCNLISPKLLYDCTTLSLSGS